MYQMSSRQRSPKNDAKQRAFLDKVSDEYRHLILIMDGLSNPYIQITVHCFTEKKKIQWQINDSWRKNITVAKIIDYPK